MIYRELPGAFSKLTFEAQQKYLELIGRVTQREIITGMTPNGPSKPGQAPAVDTGNLRSSIGFTVEPGVLTIGVAATAKYGIYLEQGTGPIRAKPGKSLKIKLKGGKVIFRKSTKGIAARPFMVPGLDRALLALKLVKDVQSVEKIT